MITNRNRTFTAPRLRSVLCLFSFIAASIALIGAVSSSRGVTQRVEKSPRRPFHLKIAPWVVEHTANGQQAEFFVVLADQADLSGAAALATKAEKARYVYDALRNKSQTTQRRFCNGCVSAASSIVPFYIVNAILVKGSREIAEALAARQDVARVEGNPHIRNALPQPDRHYRGARRNRRSRRRSSRASVTRTHRMCGRWASGVRELRSAAQILASVGLITRLSRITAAGTESRPITITIGMMPFTTVSEIPAATIRLFLATTLAMARIPSARRLATTAMGNQIGMAPGAKWIGCRNMDQGNGTPARYLECMEWFLAPYPIGGGQGDPFESSRYYG